MKAKIILKSLIQRKSLRLIYILLFKRNIYNVIHVLIKVKKKFKKFNKTLKYIIINYSLATANICPTTDPIADDTTNDVLTDSIDPVKAPNPIPYSLSNNDSIAIFFNEGGLLVKNPFINTNDKIPQTNPITSPAIMLSSNSIYDFARIATDDIATD